jgi:hypothetical protein
MKIPVTGRPTVSWRRESNDQVDQAVNQALDGRRQG